MWQISLRPAAKVKDDSVIVLDIGAIVGNFALPYRAIPFAQGITAESDLIIRNPEILIEK